MNKMEYDKEVNNYILNDQWWNSLITTIENIISIDPKNITTVDFQITMEKLSFSLCNLIHAKLLSSVLDDSYNQSFQKKTHYIIKRELNLFIESIQEFKKTPLQQSPSFHQKHKLTLVNHADRLIDALIAYHDEHTSCQLKLIEKNQIITPSSKKLVNTMGRKWMKKLINKNDQPNKKEYHQKNHHSSSFISDFFQQPKKYLFNKKFNNENNANILDKQYDSFYYDNSSSFFSHKNTTTLKNPLSIPTMSTIISPLTSPIPNQYFKQQQQLPPPQKQLLSNRKPLNTTTREVHYYDDPSFFEDDDDDNSKKCKESFHKKTNSDLTLPQLSPISFQSTNTSIRSNTSSIKSPTIHTTNSSAHSSYYSAQSTTNTYHTLNNNNNNHNNKYDNNNNAKIMEMNHLNNNKMNQHDQYIHKSTSSISKLSGSPPPKHPSNQPQKSRKKDGSIVYNVYGLHGKRMMILEIVNGKSQVVAATKEQLFLKLADESPQDFDYVDTFLSNHKSFTTSQELLYSLIDRFHIEPVPGHESYFQQWQKRIQVKVLNVLTRWIKLQFRDFLRDISLHERLEQFCDINMIKTGFATESSMIKEAMYNQKYRYYQSIYNLQSTKPVNQHHSPSTPPPSSLRRPSGSGSLFSLNHMSPPESPIYSTYHHHSTIGIMINNNNNNNSNSSPLLSLETKDIAKYLTLADYYLFQQIKSYDYLDGHWRHCQYNDFSLDELETKEDYIGILTKRANMLNHWVIHELATAKSTKHKKSLLRKFIDIAKICLEWNNFHTCMILTMGLLSYPVQKIEEVWQSLPNRDQLTFETLKKLVDVSHNMSFYRQALQEGGLHPSLFCHKKRSTSFSSSPSNPNSSLSFTNNNSHNENNLTSTSSLPTLPFFPMVLKDITFLMESDTIYCNDLDENNGDKVIEDDELIHFSKFYGLSRYLTKIMHYTSGHYWFSVELESKPFLSHHYNKLTDIPDSTRTSFSSNSVTIYQDNSYTTSSSTTALSSSQPPPPHHHSSPLSPPPPHSSSHNLWSLSTSSSISSTLNTTFFSSPFPTSFLSNNNNTIVTLDQVAEVIEKRISNVVSCYTDPQCESYLLSLLKPL